MLVGGTIESDRMSDGIYSISLLTSTTLEETTTLTTTKINSISVSSEETPGTSSSYYSTSSASSSAENISTVENGELSVFTFISPSHHHAGSNGGRGGGDLCSHTCSNHGPTHYSNGCHCRSSNSYASSYSNTDGNYDSNFSIDPFLLGGSHMYSYKGSHRAQNHILSDNYVRLLPKVSEGILLRSLEKGVLFPAVHWSSKTNENLTQHTQLGQSVVFNQGVYKELKRVIPPDIWLQRDASSSSAPKRPVWLIIGYKSLEKTLDSSLEASWKEWTGVRHIYLNLRQDFEIRKISFLNRVHPVDNLELFMYLVLMEIGNVDDSNLIWLLDFVQRTRVERMKGFLTVYTEVEREIKSIGDEYIKCLSASSASTTRSKSNGVSQPELIPPAPPSSSSSSCDDVLPSVDITTMELNGNLKLIEKLLEEIRQPPLDGYF